MVSDPTRDLRRLPRDRDHAVDITIGAEDMAAMGQTLGLIDLKKTRLTGRLVPEGGRDWRFDGHLGATVVQACVATLAPVTTRIETEVQRRYAADFTLPDEEEAEMPEDDSLDPLPDLLDLRRVTEEALSLALPLYPRAADAAPAARVFGPPGVTPMDDEAAKPLAGLAALRDRLAGAADGDEADEKSDDPDGTD